LRPVQQKTGVEKQFLHVFVCGIEHGQSFTPNALASVGLAIPGKVRQQLCRKQ
jgi:hypothetical protein